MKKLLVICGPTATGKTRLALHLAKLLDGELVSADSRQVYKDMTIGAGKDLPLRAKLKKSKLGGYYQFDKTKLWGYDLAYPQQEFSVAQYIKLANLIITDIWQRRKLPILVGGTGLYIRGIVNGIETIAVSKNKTLRKELVNKSATELFELLAGMDPVRAGSLNMSDKKNPRRLVRSIELAKAGIKLEPKLKALKADILFFGLKASKDFLAKRIDQRVKKRLKQGFERELTKLLRKGVSWQDQSLSCLGYRQWKDYLEGRKSRVQVIKDWQSQEKKYAKRQMTWFKKDKRIKWVNVEKKDWQKRIEKMAKTWYKQQRYA
jgi:tRNA dimethylallyltransferase